MAKYTEFGRMVKKILIDREVTARWLAGKVRERTGAYCDDAYLSRILSGKKRSPRLERAIREILDMDTV